MTLPEAHPLVVRLGIVSIELKSIGEDAPVEVLAADASEKRVRWFELVLVLILAFGGSFLNSLYLMNTGKAALSMISGFRWARGFVQEIPCLFLLWYVLSRRRLSFRDIGLRCSVRDVIVGFFLTIASYFAYLVGGFIVYSVHHTFFPPGTKGVSAADLSSHSAFLAIPFALINPFFEELIVRAFLMTEVKALTGSWFLAAVSSVTLQWSYHLYYGWDGSLSIAFTFLVFSIYFARTRKATPLIVAHGVLDLWALWYWK
jgi:membrane protease YdiL (CAAX protease family)